MATYKEIKGVTIQTLDEDPVIGGIAGATWASGNAIPASGYYWGSAGTQTSNIIAGGYDTAIIGTAFQYDGTDWTSVSSINDAREMVTGWGASNTAALIVAGDSPGFTGATEQWDGSSWTEKNDLNTTRIQGGGAGTSYTSGIFFGGRTPPNTKKDETESWNGTSWTEVGDLNTAIRAVGGFGTTTAAISAGGDAAPGGTQTGVESWNGSAWTELSGTLNTGRNAMAVSGTQTAGLVFGGSPPVTTKTEAWNGTTFTEVNDMANPLYARGGSPAGTQTAALASGGQPSSPSPTNFTEEFSAAPVTAATLTEGDLFLSGGTTLKGFGKAAGIPAATWASSGALNSPRGNAGTSGTQTAALFFGGDGPPGTIAITELYNGSSWTEVGDLNVARSQTFFSNQGTSTAALNATGSPIATNVESWDGSSWTETTDLNTARRNGASLGTQTAMLGTGGYNPPSYKTLTEIWDGSSWTETGDCPDAKFISQGGGGTTTAGIIAGNHTNGDVDSSQTWDGTSWTNGPNINTGRSGIAFSAQSQSSALAHGGGVGTPQAASALCEFYNGTAWTELNDMAQASQSGGGAGSSVLGIHYGGYSPGALTTTEEWTADNALSTVTVS